MPTFIFEIYLENLGRIKKEEASQTLIDGICNLKI
jgi:hypothetical protein